MEKVLLFFMVIVSVRLWSGSIDNKYRENAYKAQKNAVETEFQEIGKDGLYPVKHRKVGSLGSGYFAYALSGRKNEDYTLYFFQQKNCRKTLKKSGLYADEADYILPDVREDNAAIGKFFDIYFFDIADITGDGRKEVLIIARYERDGRKYFDTRVYEITENGFCVNEHLVQELNAKYHDAENYPLHKLYGFLPGLYLHMKTIFSCKVHFMGCSKYHYIAFCSWAAENIIIPLFASSFIIFKTSPHK